MTINITDEQKQQFEQDGYFVLESVIPNHFLQLLRGECQNFIDTTFSVSRYRYDTVGELT